MPWPRTFTARSSWDFPPPLASTAGGNVQAHLEELLGARVFEISTLPPSIAGLRLRAAFESHLPERGIRVYSQKLVQGAEDLSDSKGFRLRIVGQGAANLLEPTEPEFSITARTVIHAGGRFFGKGLRAERTGIVEPVFGLPVEQPETRALWHNESFFAPQGHAVNTAGLVVDSAFRPLLANGAPARGNLFAAGSILAHQDWMRQKCGAGLAIATAYAAVREAAKGLNG